mgnify:CR=1 FL=1
MRIENIGFIGLGAMGSVMAPLLGQSGYNVLGYDIGSKIEKSTGVSQVQSLNDLKNMDVIIFMLPNSKIVAQVINDLLDINTKSILIDTVNKGLNLIMLKYEENYYYFELLFFPHRKHHPGYSALWCHLGNIINPVITLYL